MMQKRLGRVVVFWLLSSFVAAHGKEDQEKDDASLAALVELPIRRYEMAHDTVSGRVHYGVLAADAQKSFGHIYKEKMSREESVPGAGGLTRAVVDSSILFMHGLSAIRRLAKDIPMRRRHVEYALGRGKQLVENVSIVSLPISDPKFQNAHQLQGERRVVETCLENAEFEVYQFTKKKERTIEFYRYKDRLRNATAIQAYEMILDRQDFGYGLKNETLFFVYALENEYIAFAQEESLKTELEILEHTLELSRHKEELRRETALEVALEEERKKAEAERLNEDISLRLIEARGEEQRQKLLNLVQAVSHECQAAAESLRSNPQRLWRLVVGFILLIAGFFFSREFAILSRCLLEAYLTRPALVREASFSSFFSFKTTKKNKTHIFDGVILDDDLKPRLESLAHSLRGARALRAPLRHIMLYGPPGTGKTLVARTLALASGLDWAVASGGDIGPLGPSATTELHKLLNWAQRSPRGLLLFIDEAEAALADRGRPNLSEDAVSALNAFLTHTSEPSYSVVLVLATNRPADIDAAVLDRIDEVIQLPLPNTSARLSLLHLYFNKCFKPLDKKMENAASLYHKLIHASHFAVPTARIDPDFDVNAHLNTLLPQTKGFSGREISKLMLSIQAAVFSHHDTSLILTSAIWNEALLWKLQEVKPKKMNDDGFSSFSFQIDKADYDLSFS